MFVSSTEKSVKDDMFGVYHLFNYCLRTNASHIIAGNDFCPPVTANNGKCSGIPYLPIYGFRECSCNKGYAFETMEERINLACLPGCRYNQELPYCKCECNLMDTLEMGLVFSISVSVAMH